MIPSTCLRRSQCVDVAEDLVRSGYQIHVVGVFGEKATIVERGLFLKYLKISCATFFETFFRKDTRERPPWVKDMMPGSLSSL